MALAEAFRAWVLKAQGKLNAAPVAALSFTIPAGKRSFELWVDLTEEPFVIVGVRVCTISNPPDELREELHELQEHCRGMLHLNGESLEIVRENVFIESSVDSVMTILADAMCGEAGQLLDRVHALSAQYQIRDLPEEVQTRILLMRDTKGNA